MTSPEELLRERQEEARVGRMWRAIEARRRPSKARRLPMVTAATLVVSAIAVVAAVLWPRPVAPEPGPLTLAGSQTPVPAAIESEREVRFADGSRVEARPESRLDLLENTASELAFALRRGSAHFEVAPGGPRRWRVAAGDVEVVVVGTVFDVDRSQGVVTVSVSRGAVRVRGPGVRDGEQRIEAGERLVVEPPSEAPPVPVPLAAEEQPVVPEPAAGPAAPETPEPPSPAELLAEADAARAEGDVRAAVHLLERVWREHPRDSRAPLAAFTQGRLELDRLNDAAGAAATLGRALELGLQDPLRETAEALRIDAWGRLGDRRAGAAAERFLAEHPESEYRGDVSRWLSAGDETGAGQ